ncbi:transglutaminase-like domain-containing protein [Carboxylicivirga linearis]|uniref:Transglutaminase domain-containing protein n=1 Tax=Carboxylicivirga linearis TaxID=1628157 RepID=A0ABS5JUG8_9BACT|nr:transglutaminase domain-containing protein [Carboxylicivirga linearis]MBS2098564.1 transglutaminase domain-containing protein [Carboxylicivirga linearis]
MAQSQHALVKKYDTHINFNNNKVIVSTEVEILINSPKGTNYAEVDIYSEDKLKDIQASLVDLFGYEIRKLKKKDLKYSNAYSNSTFHNDGIYTSFSLLYNQYPYVLKYTYSFEIKNYIHLYNWLPTYKFDDNIEEATLIATLPIDYSFKTIENKIDTTYTTLNEANTEITYYWKVFNPQHPTKERFSPSQYSLAPRVEIIPEKFHYGLDGSTESWQSFGNWLYQLNYKLDRLTVEEQIRVHQLTDTISNTRDKIKVLYHYMQDNTRYINVSLELGGLQTYPAEYVCNNKYGDCKALTNYMKALLKEAGIKSNYTIVYADTNPVRIKEEFPSNQFNHVILCVPQPNDTVWLECTDSTAPFNYLGSFTQNRKALVIDNNNSKLVHTPIMTTEQCRNNFSTTVIVNTKKASIINSNAVLKGRNYEFFKQMGNNIPKSQQPDLLDRINLIKGVDFTEIHHSIPNRDMSIAKLSFTAQIPNLAEEMGNKILIRPINSYSFKMEKPEKRTQPVVINMPIVRSDTILYQCDQPIKSLKGLNDSDLTTPFGGYRKKVQTYDKTIAVIRDIVIYAGTYPNENYNEFYSFIKKINQFENQKILITY